MEEIEFKVEKDENSERELKYVNQCLEDAGKYSLQVEVVVWALKAMKAHPELTVQEAMERGMEEWDV